MDVVCESVPMLGHQCVMLAYGSTARLARVRRPCTGRAGVKLQCLSVRTCEDLRRKGIP